MTARTISIATARNTLLGIGMVGILGVFAVLVAPVPGAKPPAERVIAAPVVSVPAPVKAPVVAKPVAPVAKPAVSATTPAAYRVDSFLTRPDNFEHGDYLWKDEGVPAGPVLITVDVATQLIHVFRSGREIGTAVVLYGADDSPTPLGIFPIMDKDADHVSSTFGAPMPYNLRLTGGGVAVHGSSHMRYGWATNGCVGLPVAFAKLLFDQVKVGDRVIISRGKTPVVGETVPLT